MRRPERDVDADSCILCCLCCAVRAWADQVVGVRRDGAPRIMLSDLDCASLNEDDLDEGLGVSCEVGSASKGHSFSTMIRGRYYEINKPIDFNGDGNIEDGENIQPTAAHCLSRCAFCSSISSSFRFCLLFRVLRFQP